MKRRLSDHELAEQIAKTLTDSPSGGQGPAADARVLLQRARDAGMGGVRTQCLAEAQRCIARLDPMRHRATIQRLQADVLALQGRGGDSRVAHLTPGEVVVPRSLQTPQFLQWLRMVAQAQGIDPARLVVGSNRNSVNPNTGQEEFFDDNGEEIEGITVPSNSNGPNVPAPSNESLHFDPNGPGWWKTVAEHPIAAIPATAIGAWTRFVDNKPENYSGNLHNDSADAYRHARASQRLTEWVGPDTAKQFTDAYERSHPDPNGERLMDLYNNQVGRGLGGGKDAVEDALKRGILRTSPFKR
jgi:hypothetical protein